MSDRRRTTHQPRRSTPARSSSRRWSLWYWWVGGGVVAAIAMLWGLNLTLSGPEVTGRELNVSSGSDSSVGVSASDLPDFPILMYQGADIVGSDQPQFLSLFDGRPIVLNYWASSCPPCAAEMPEFEKVWQDYKDRVLFIGLDVGRFVGFGNAETSKKELKQLGVTYAAGTPLSVEVVQKLEVLGLPTTVFLTPEGKVHKKWTGILNESKLTELVNGLIAA